MYLVELKPGREELYRTGDDLALAIRDGDVDARSRIYHRATAKWISITLHPQYKAIVAGQEEAERPARKGWGLLSTPAGGVPLELSAGDSPVMSGAIRQRWKRPMGLGLASILLLLGVQLAFSGPRPRWERQGNAAAIGTLRPKSGVKAARPVSRAQDGMETDRLGDYELDMVSLASTSSRWPLRATPAGDSVTVPPPPEEMAMPVLPRAPRLRSKALRAALVIDEPKVEVKSRSIQALIDRYEVASNEAYTRLQSRIRAARLNRLFAPGRLTAGGGVPDTRLSLAGAANFIRVYRQQQAGIERAYQDSVTMLAKRNGWTSKDMKQWASRTQRKESPTLELLSNALLAGIDSLLGVLDAQAGAYKLRGTAIAFENPGATQAYGSLRRRIREQIDAAVSAGAATSFGPSGLLLQAIGTSTLPRET